MRLTRTQHGSTPPVTGIGGTTVGRAQTFQGPSDGYEGCGPALVRTIGRPPPSVGRLQDVGVISDLDQTIIPTHDGPKIPAPYGGIVEILDAIQRDAGKVFYVTARSERTATPIPAYMARHQLPTGRIDVGPGGGRDASVQGKLDDIRAIFERNPNRKFIFFGDSSHVDAEVYRTIASEFPDRVIATFIHDVKPIESERVDGMHLIHSYADAAEVLRGLN